MIIFSGFQGFLIYLTKYFWSLWNSSRDQSKQSNFLNRYKRFPIFIFANFVNFFHKASKKKLALDLFYCFSREIWLEDWWKLVCTDQSRSFISYAPDILNNFKMFLYLSNTLPASWAAHIKRGFMLFLFAFSFHRKTK